MRAQFIPSIDQIAASDWNNLATDNNPFLNHAFLAALEHHGAASLKNGWTPQHLIVTDGERLLGALPLYLKDHSYGEFVFDWAWANAYTRAGLNYYPKLVVAVPYTPVTGPRILLNSSLHCEQQAKVVALMTHTLLEFAKRGQYSSLHFLFIDANDRQRLHIEQQDYLLRYGYQFHWFNRDYTDFDDYLADLTAKNRKKIRRERRRIKQQDISIDCLTGNTISQQQWQFFHQCYQATFDKKSNFAPLTNGFFAEIGANLNSQVILLIAKQSDLPVASAMFLRSDDTLYGRYWGCVKDFDCLHFELCYYQAIDYCIRHNLKHCEAGAQGEHKVSRGFSPITTYSAHWINHQQFRAAIDEFVRYEKTGVEEYIEEMANHLPYR